MNFPRILCVKLAVTGTALMFPICVVFWPLPLQAFVVLDYRGDMSQSLVINLGFPTLPHKK